MWFDFDDGDVIVLEVNLNGVSHIEPEGSEALATYADHGVGSTTLMIIVAVVYLSQSSPRWFLE